MRGEGEDARPSSCCPPQGPGHVLPSLEASLALSELSQPLKVCVPRCHSSYTPHLCTDNNHGHQPHAMQAPHLLSSFEEVPTAMTHRLRAKAAHQRPWGGRW